MGYLHFGTNSRLFHGNTLQSLICFRSQVTIRTHPLSIILICQKPKLTSKALRSFASSLVSQRPLLLLCKFFVVLRPESPTRPGQELLLPGSSQVRDLRVREWNTDREPKSQRARGTSVPQLNSQELLSQSSPPAPGLLPPAASPSIGCFIFSVSKAGLLSHHSRPMASPQVFSSLFVSHYSHSVAQPPNLGVSCDFPLSVIWQW